MIPQFLDQAMSSASSPVGLYYNAYKTRRWGDPYTRLVARLADKARLAIDVGAHNGDYTYLMRRHARRCVAFECNPTLVSRLTRLFGQSVDVRAEAVSDTEGSAVLRIPRDEARGLGRATIEHDNRLEQDFPDMVEVEVRTVRLDDVIDAPVGLLKIDVEGHEMAVLHGAARLLEASRPNLVVELEERHNAGILRRAFDFLGALGYRAAILRDGRLTPFALGDDATDQVNYVFTHGRTAAHLS